MVPILEQYISPEYRPQRKFLPDATYADVLDSCVLACVDVFVYHKGAVLLGKRRERPALGQYWILGGRMNPGERFEETARRILARESEIVANDLSRFVYLGVKNYVWPDRAQAPQHNGCHMVGFYYAIHVSEAEVHTMRLAADFTDGRWVNLQEVATGALLYHAAMRSLADQVLNAPLPILIP